MQKFITVFLLLALICSACSNKKQAAPFIDVAGYLRGQLAELDSLGYRLNTVRVNKENKTIDSGTISTEKLRKKIEPFLSDALSRRQLEKHFSESVFADAGLLSVTITYTPVTGRSPFQRIDVYIKPADGSISRVYASHNSALGDTLVHTQLLWKHAQLCTLITTRTLQQLPIETVTETISWQ